MTLNLFSSSLLIMSWRSVVLSSGQKSILVFLLLALFSNSFLTRTRGSLERRKQGSSLDNTTLIPIPLLSHQVKRSPLLAFPFVQDKSLISRKSEARQYGGGGHGHGHGGGWGWGDGHVQHYYHQQDKNTDLYSLLAGLSVAGLLGATIIFLARRNTSGRRRRSLDSVFDDEDDGYADTLILDAIHDPKF